MKELLLGIDIGTSACKVALFRKSGEVVAAANGEYKVYYPKPGYAEQDPNEWWTAVCKATKECIGGHRVYTEGERESFGYCRNWRGRTELVCDCD